MKSWDTDFTIVMEILYLVLVYFFCISC